MPAERSIWGAIPNLSGLDELNHGCEDPWSRSVTINLILILSQARWTRKENQNIWHSPSFRSWQEDKDLRYDFSILIFLFFFLFSSTFKIQTSWCWLDNLLKSKQKTRSEFQTFVNPARRTFSILKFQNGTSRVRLGVLFVILFKTSVGETCVSFRSRGCNSGKFSTFVRLASARRVWIR